MAEDDREALRRTVAVGCRILGHRELAEDVLGHISVRTGRGRMLIRCRGPEEEGLLFTRPEDVQEVAVAADAVADGDHVVPNELPIHVAILTAHPWVRAVVHAHPPAVVAADLAGVPLVPLIGAYNIPAARLAVDGIPVYRRGVLISDLALGEEMVAAMGASPVCVLRGHGITAVGTSVEQAVARALAVDSLARMACRVAAAGGTPVPLPEADLEQLPDLGGGFNDGLLWRHHVARLWAAGLGLDDGGGQLGPGPGPGPDGVESTP